MSTLEEVRAAAEYVAPISYRCSAFAERSGISIFKTEKNENVWDVLHALYQNHKILAEDFLSKESKLPPDSDIRELTEILQRNKQLIDAFKLCVKIDTVLDDCAEACKLLVEISQTNQEDVGNCCGISLGQIRNLTEKVIRETYGQPIPKPT